MKKLSMLIFCIAIISCGRNAKEQKEVNENIKDAMEIVKDLPKISKEIEAQKKKISAQKVNGNLTLTIEGKTTTFKDWDASKSRISFFDHKINYIFRLMTKEKAYFSVSITHKSLWPNPTLNEYASTMHMLDYSDEAFMEKVSTGYIHLTYVNEATKEEYETYKGTVTLNSWSENALSISFDGDGFEGDWKERNIKPIKFQMELSHDFNTVDKRTSK